MASADPSPSGPVPTRLAPELIARWQRLARRPVIAVSAICGLTLACALLLTWTAGIPEPQAHDEAAMLVMADIFAQGRLCEPPHRFWQHFEDALALTVATAAEGTPAALATAGAR